MVHLIREALTEEVQELLPPTDAWERQRTLLASAGLLEGSLPVPNRRAGWGSRLGWIAKAGGIVALLLLALGAGEFSLWRAGSPTAPKVPATSQPLATGVLLPETAEFEAVRVPVISAVGGLDRRPAVESGTGLMIDILRQWLAEGRIVGRLPSWRPSPALLDPIYLDLAGGGSYTIQTGASCYGAYDPAFCWSLIGLPDGSGVMLVQEDLSRWMDGQLWEPRQAYVAQKFWSPQGYRLTPEAALLAAPKYAAQLGQTDMRAVSGDPKLIYDLKYDDQGRWRVAALPGWSVTLESGVTNSKAAATLLFAEEYALAPGASPLSLSYYPDGLPAVQKP